MRLLMLLRVASAALTAGRAVGPRQSAARGVLPRRVSAALLGPALGVRRGMAQRSLQRRAEDRTGLPADACPGLRRVGARCFMALGVPRRHCRPLGVGTTAHHPAVMVRIVLVVRLTVPAHASPDARQGTNWHTVSRFYTPRATPQLSEQRTARGHPWTCHRTRARCCT